LQTLATDIMLLVLITALKKCISVMEIAKIMYTLLILVLKINNFFKRLQFLYNGGHRILSYVKLVFQSYLVISTKLKM